MNDNHQNLPPSIELATVLIGATPFKEGNVNDTYRGQILLSNGDVRDAILKDLDGIQLVNELLAAALAKASGLPIPDAYIGLVRNGDLALNRAPALEDGNRIVFASADVKVPNVTFQINKSATSSHRRAIIERIVNWSKLGELYAFDAWIANTDRHPGNLLLGATDEIWLIDHGHSFTGPTWEPSGLLSDGDYVNRLEEWLTPNLHTAHRSQRAMEVTEMSKAFLSTDVALARSVSKIDTLRSSAHGDAIETFLQERARTACNHATKALGMLV